VTENAAPDAGLATTLNALNRFIGRAVALLTIVMVVVMAVVVAERYLFNSGSIRLQESITFMHAAVFMLVAAYTLQAGGHVRVDIFYSRMQARGKALVDLFGTLLLLMPFCLFLLWTSWDYVSVSWAAQESSQETGGLPYPFPPMMKSFMPAAAILLMVQGIVFIIEALTVILNKESRN